MKRKVLFKAKRADNGEWVEGFYEYNKDDDMHFIRTYENRDTIEVVPETVCQYTGLKDKNGKMIFEGDILNVGENLSATIEYIGENTTDWGDEVHCAFHARIKSISMGKETKLIHIDYYFKDNCSVTSNIHD